MAEPLALAFVASTRPWQQRLNRHLHSYATNERLVAIVADPRDLFEEEWRVLLIDAASVWLTVDLTAQIHAAGRGVIAVVEPGDDRARARALAAKVDAPLEADATAEELATAAHAVARAYPPSRRRPPGQAPARVSRAAAPGGQVIAVGGPPGSRPERVAVALAAVLGRREHVVVVDANDVDPCLAPRLGLHPQPNLVDALARPDEAVALLHDVAGGGFWALPGLAAPAQWSTVPVTGVRRLITGLARSYDRVVLITGPVVEDAARFRLTLTAIAAAQAIVPVGEASLVGLASLTEWIAGAHQVTAAPLWPVAAHVALGRAGQADVVEQLEKVARLVSPDATVTLVPGPGRGENRGRWDGRLYRDRGLMRPVSRLAREVTT